MPIIPLKARVVLLTMEPHLLPMLSIILQMKSDNHFSNHLQVACPHWSLKLRACDKYCAAQKSAPVLTVRFPGYLYLRENVGPYDIATTIVFCPKSLNGMLSVVSLSKKPAGYKCEDLLQNNM